MENMTNVVRNMKNRLVKIDSELDELRLENKRLKDELGFTKQSLEKDASKMKDTFEHEKTEMTTIIDDLERKISVLRNPDFFHACATFFSDVSFTGDQVTYNHLLYSSSSDPDSFVDIETGIFTARIPGTYSVSWALRADNAFNDPSVSLYLRKNGVRIQESLIGSQNWQGYPDTIIFDQGKTNYLLILREGF